MRVIAFALPGLAAAVLAWLLTPRVIWLATRIGAVDQPSARKVHRLPTPRLGGVAVFGAVFAVFAATGSLTGNLELVPLWMGIGLGLLPILVVSAIDDVRGLRPWTKFVGHVAGAGLAAGCGVLLNPDVHLFGQTIHIGVWAIPVSILWLVGVTNAFNLVDGLDGLAAGLALISAGSLVAVFVVAHQTAVAVATSMLAGAILGFLPYNMYPAKVFLGDTGATGVGFCLACLSLRGGSTLSAGFATLLPVIVLGLPVAETFLSMARRVVGRKNGDSAVFTADRKHIHHRLLDLGWRHQNAVFVLYGIGLAFAGVGLVSLLMTVQEAGLLVAGLLLAGFVGLGRLGYEEFAVIRSGFVLKFYDAPVLKRSMFVVFVDLFFVALAIYSAIGLKYDDWALLQYRRLGIAMMATLGPATVAVLWLLGSYRGSWRLASVYDVVRICLSVTIAAGAGFLLIRGVSNQSAPLSLFVIYALVKLGLANGSRLSYRVLATTRSQATARGARVLIYGAGQGGASAAREMLSNPNVGMKPVGYIDDDEARSRKAVNGIPIVGSVAQLESCVRDRRVSAVVISSHKISADRVALAHRACEAAGVRLLRMQIRFDRCDRPEPEFVPEGSDAMAVQDIQTAYPDVAAL